MTSLSLDPEPTPKKEHEAPTPTMRGFGSSALTDEQSRPSPVLPGLSRDTNGSGDVPVQPDSRSPVDRLRAHTPQPTVLAATAVDSAVAAWKDEWLEGERPLPPSARMPGRDELNEAIKDVKKSSRSFSSADEVKAALDHHLFQIGPFGRELQTAMFRAKPVPTGGFGNKVTIRTPRSKEHERVAQLLKHISQLVFSSIKVLTQEVESLYVNNVLVIAGNEAAAADKFLELAQQATSEAGIDADSNLLQQLVEMAVRSDRRTIDVRLESAATKVAGLIERKREKAQERPGPDVQLDAQVRSAHEVDADEYQTLAAIVRTAHVPAKVHSRAEVLEAIDAGTPRIMFMHGTNIHAEQQLVRILLTSSVRAQHATIRGTKRPCFGCYLALEYAQQFQGADGLDHGSRPGGFWLNSCQSAHEYILENPGTKSPEQAHAWFMSTARTLLSDGVNKTRKIKEGTRGDGVTPYLATSASRGDANADTDSESEAEESALSPEYLTLVRKLRTKPIPRPRAAPKRKQKHKEEGESAEDEAESKKAPKKTRRKAPTKRKVEPGGDVDAENPTKKSKSQHPNPEATSRTKRKPDARRRDREEEEHEEDYEEDYEAESEYDSDDDAPHRKRKKGGTGRP